MSVRKIYILGEDPKWVFLPIIMIKSNFLSEKFLIFLWRKITIPLLGWGPRRAKWSASSLFEESHYCVVHLSA